MNAALDTLATEYWEYLRQLSPLGSSLRGEHDYDDQVDDLSRRAEDDAIAALDGFAARAEAIDPAELSPDEQVTREVLGFEASTHAAELRSRLAEFAVDPSMGLHVVLLQLMPSLPITESAHAEALLTRYGKFGALFDQQIGRLRQGVARQRTPYETAIEKSISQCDDYLASPIESDLFVIGPQPPPSFDDAATAQWRERLSETVRDAVRPAYQRFRDALVDEVMPKARPDERCGLSWIEGGEEAYARAVRRYTSLELTPYEIHQVGLDAIAALADEYRTVAAGVLGTTDLDEIFDRLRNDQSLRFSTADEVKDAGDDAMARAKAAMVDWFGRLPVADCVMAEIPAGGEEAPLAYYLPPSTDGSRPGTFFINTTEPTTRTRYESEALAFHESIPGHHLQLAIAQELGDIPEFRKHALVTAYVEGWGLYTERLADEMGLYSGDLARMGMASFDSWRSGRLVVDTGMHALGWSRQDAIDYLTENSPQAPNNIVSEVDRYVGWPGQALAYKLGQREIFALRDEATAAMGARFDIKGFHDVVLGSGPVPLPTLRRLVETWMSAPAQ